MCIRDSTHTHIKAGLRWDSQQTRRILWYGVTVSKAKTKINTNKMITLGQSVNKLYRHRDTERDYNFVKAR